MKRFRLLLLDAGIVMKLFEIGLWDEVVRACEVHLARTVVDHEARYYSDGKRDVRIDLAPHIDGNQIEVFDESPSAVASFLSRFDPTYLSRLDPGEAEALTRLCGSDDDCMICSADAIVFIVLGRLRRTEQGISLEELLTKLGYGRAMEWRFSKAFRERWTRKGQEDAITDTGLAK